MFYKKNGKDLIINKQSSLIESEAYKIARTNLIYLLTNRSQNKVLITSASPSEGKTTICTNLAVTFAKVNKKVIIIDSDMRNPQIHRIFNVEPFFGLSNVLSGSSDLFNCIKETQISNLNILTAGTIVQNPAELLESPSFTEMINVLSERYDYIFIDAPPVNLFADAVLISNKVDGVVIVAKYAYTKKKMIIRTIDMFKKVNANIMGVIINNYDVDSYYELLGSKRLGKDYSVYGYK